MVECPGGRGCAGGFGISASFLLKFDSICQRPPVTQPEWKEAKARRLTPPAFRYLRTLTKSPLAQLVTEVTRPEPVKSQGFRSACENTVSCHLSDV